MQGGRDLTLPQKNEPGVLDPMEPASPFREPMLSTGAMNGVICGSSTRPCGTK